uniref:Secreted protein n=1 Tax=Rhipicephalus appendiculatus TaxID=34631 RepID=A0A131YE52_RHIAP
MRRRRHKTSTLQACLFGLFIAAETAVSAGTCAEIKTARPEIDMAQLSCFVTVIRWYSCALPRTVDCVSWKVKLSECRSSEKSLNNTKSTGRWVWEK